MNHFLRYDFIFSPRYRFWRHLVYWSLHVAVWAVFWVVIGAPVSYARQLLNMTMWVPAFIIFCYPLVYFAIPKFLLKGKLIQFFIIMLGWGAIGLFVDIGYRNYILIPLQKAMGLQNIIPKGKLPYCFLCMTTSAAGPMIFQFFKLWTKKQMDWLREQQEKTIAELQLLKSQVHPHFLFNTLNNIYSFSLSNSPETPALVLKLTSLLRYMLNECKADEVKLEKEIEVMRHYIDLEKERYGNKIDIRLNVDGDLKHTMIAPLLLLPFLENAFKHGMSDQLTNPRLQVDITTDNSNLCFKIYNTKNEMVVKSEKGIGIDNVRKRLACIYPDNHKLIIKDSGSTFMVYLHIKLKVEMPILIGSKFSTITQRAIPA
jgi:hypothetical protein